MTMTPPRTLNPLHFEDLEPHRFEDLVRQLVHGWKDWRLLEATGRLGSDDGFDIRGIEIVRQEGDNDIAQGNGEEDYEFSTPPDERVWQIQCKREKAIGPTKVKSIVAANLDGSAEIPHAFVLVAACDFSKHARDVFHQEVRVRGVIESHIWGKAELEDRLLLPENDRLLFAYFNFSLQSRRNSQRTLLRSRISIKKSLVKHVSAIRDTNYKVVLVKDVDAQHYPDASRVVDFRDKKPWWYYQILGHEPPDHLLTAVQSFYAYMDDNDERWDALLGAPFDPAGYANQDVMSGKPVKGTEQGSTDFWANSVPERNRATLHKVRFLPYDRILVVDGLGDSCNEGPHLIVACDPVHGPFNAEIRWLVESSDSLRRRLLPSDENRIHFFADDISAASSGQLSKME